MIAERTIHVLEEISKLDQSIEISNISKLHEFNFEFGEFHGLVENENGQIVAALVTMPEGGHIKLRDVEQNLDLNNKTEDFVVLDIQHDLQSLGAMITFYFGNKIKVSNNLDVAKDSVLEVVFEQIENKVHINFNLNGRKITSLSDMEDFKLKNSKAEGMFYHNWF